MLKNLRFEQEEENLKEVSTEGTLDIPYELVSAVGDIIIVDQNKLTQYQNELKAKEVKSQQVKRPAPTIKK